MAFAGLRVLSLESRRAGEMGVLVSKQGGDYIVAPSMREIPIADNPDVLAFYDSLRAGQFDMVVLLTGVGARAVDSILAPYHGPGAFADALKSVAVVPRGPKPQAVLREWGVPWAVSVPSPNTWRELLAVTADRPERRVAVQEYGRSNEDLLAALRARGCSVTPVRVYQWALPADTAPLREAARRVARGEIDVLLLTTSMQLPHLVQMAAEEGVAVPFRVALQRMAICSIGPTTSDTLEDMGFRADMEPSLPKMGILVKEAAEQASDIIARKRERTCNEETVSGN
ncbi:MAG TPA: uroporphyrinogen-III synthase [Bryobacteraceae bacterium]|nr:uroporphyrinogen-III synthase [Bryobacteraceae bacterium]